MPNKCCMCGKQATKALEVLDDSGFPKSEYFCSNECESDYLIKSGYKVQLATRIIRLVNALSDVKLEKKEADKDFKERIEAIEDELIELRRQFFVQTPQMGIPEVMKSINDLEDILDESGATLTITDGENSATLGA